MWYLHIMDYYSEIKRNEFLIHTIYMNLKGITLKKRQSPQVTYCIFPLTRYFQKDRKKKKKKHSHIKQISGFQRLDVGGK